MDDREILNRLVEDEKFVPSALFEDKSEDWGLAKSFAELVLRIVPDDLPHRLILARACRHLGEGALARSALAECQAIIDGGEVDFGEKEVISPMVEEEKRLLVLDTQ